MHVPMAFLGPHTSTVFAEKVQVGKGQSHLIYHVSNSLFNSSNEAAANSAVGGSREFGHLFPSCTAE